MQQICPGIQYPLYILAYTQRIRPRGEEAAYPLRGTPAERDYLQVTTGIMDSGRLAAAAKNRGATINTYLAALILQALVGIAKEDKRKGLARRPVKLSMPVNLRKYYKSSTLPRLTRPNRALSQIHGPNARSRSEQQAHPAAPCH